jgi:hypothetical protein
MNGRNQKYPLDSNSQHSKRQGSPEAQNPSSRNEHDRNNHLPHREDGIVLHPEGRGSDRVFRTRTGIPESNGNEGGSKVFFSPLAGSRKAEAGSSGNNRTDLRVTDPTPGSVDDRTQYALESPAEYSWHVHAAIIGGALLMVGICYGVAYLIHELAAAHHVVLR